MHVYKWIMLNEKPLFLKTTIKISIRSKLQCIRHLLMEKEVCSKNEKLYAFFFFFLNILGNVTTLLSFAALIISKAAIGESIMFGPHIPKKGESTMLSAIPSPIVIKTK